MFGTFSNAELVCALENNLGKERSGLVAFLKMLVVVDGRRLYAGLGYPSLFSFCTDRLKLSESCAQKRIHVCRMATKFPVAIDFLEKGSLHLTALSMLAPHVNSENFETLLKSAVGKTQDELRQMLAINFVMPEKKDSMKIVMVKTEVHAEQIVQENRPNLQNSGTEALPIVACAARDLQAIQTKTFPKTEIQERASISFQCSKELFENIKRCQELLRHKHPNGKLEDVMNELVEAFLNKKDPKRKAVTKEIATVKTEEKIKPETEPEAKVEAETSKHLRYIPALVKRQALQKANYQCTYQSQGVRCKATSLLEFDHKIPHALNGKNTTENIQILCRTHNDFKARQQFGNQLMNRYSKIT